MKHIEPRHLEAFFDGELSAAEVRQVQDHLAQCDACRREAKALERIAGAVRDARGVDLQQVRLRTFADEVSRRLAGRESHVPRWWQRIRLAWNVEWGILQRSAVVACGLALLLGIGLVWHDQITSQGGTDLPPACRIEYIEPGVGANVTVIADSEAAVVLVSTGDTG